MGEEADRELKAAGIPTRPTIFDEPYLAADAHSVFRLLVDDDPRERCYVAVGSGTITDIVRFVAHRTGRDFVSLATAPSVDAYASVVAPLVVDGVKRTVPACAPIAIFADSEVLAHAPKPMIAAGFGDMICKFTAVADWRLGALLWGESFDEAIARRSVAAASTCVEAASAIGAAEPEGLAILMAALIESGLCMAEAGHSRPASGAEHQYSHYWEMRLLAEHRPPILHGLKVGIGTLEAARLWDFVRSTNKKRVADLLSRARLPSRATEERRIRTAYGCAADGTIAGQERFLAMSDIDFEDLKRRILESWDEILSFARTVPSAAETERLLILVGCPTNPLELGLRRREIALGLSSAHFIRDRFTVKKLVRLLGIA
jgi:glycerol-1-phosphate dehydrogenase [NAD(P)+]